MEKTLTSIEQVYQDLSYKSQYSECEPEFRAYMIYLSLNETNVVMKHLSRVPERFQKNPHICRARRVISAFMLGNYSVFWHEVKKCTILEASALHRYFNQVRRQAIVKIKSAYSPTDQLKVIQKNPKRLKILLIFKDKTKFDPH